MERGAKTHPRPHVILNAAVTLDGKIATRSGDSKISSPEDLSRVHELRASVDAIMVGVNTVLMDDPKLTTKKPGGKNPMRVIVDSRAKTPPTAQALTVDRSTKTVIATTEKAPKESLEKLSQAGAEVVVCGSDEGVDLKLLMSRLGDMGVRTLLLEGGGTLNWSMISSGLVDEISIAVAPIVVGGVEAKTLVEGEGVERITAGFRFRLEKVEKYGDDLVLFYKKEN